MATNLLVERLRAADKAKWPTLHEAADEIDRLRAENERLRAANDALLGRICEAFGWDSTTYAEAKNLAAAPEGATDGGEDA